MPENLIVTVNGKMQSIPSESTINHVLSRLDLEIDSIAVAVNESFVPRSTYDQVTLKNGDHLEIVSPMVGG